MTKAPEEVIRFFQLAGTVCRCREQELIYLQGEESPNLYLVTRGRVRMFYIGDDGKEVTYQIIGEGQLFGESAFLSHISRPTSISAVTDVELISCRIAALRPYLRQSEILSETIFSLLTDNYRTLCNQVRRLGLDSSERRIASYLLEHTEHDSPGVGVVDHTLPYTHEELGVCLGLNRVTVTKVLNDFRRKGVVVLGRKKIRVTDPDGLKAVLNEREKPEPA